MTPPKITTHLRVELDASARSGCRVFVDKTDEEVSDRVASVVIEPLGRAHAILHAIDKEGEKFVDDTGNLVLERNRVVKITGDWFWTGGWHPDEEKR